MNLNPVFDSPIPVANYLYKLNPEISPIKLQKALYFLYAYHGGLYYNQDNEGESEGVKEPKTLFHAAFEAWKYGPVIREVYQLNKQGKIGTPEGIEKTMSLMENHLEEKHFIDDLFRQINGVSDFALVERSHRDIVWEKTYGLKEDIKLMDNESIIQEYKEQYI
ncbi:DUF4065 domain-containing protein [Bacillus anthracis]|uniref:Panacea domain-containing protein n=1 Tax=Bacillus anthracis TaxID=1392 RepID=UPI002DB62EA8|nr:type II toxin-antitoxin system antitoxin SocA domain-containing protein [Bacillus anthracis]MEB9507245.1 DUF4065 domain-containing protein [Bacillus anthracis]